MTKHTISYGILAMFYANGAKPPYAGQWLEDFDFDAYDGQGFGSFTPNASLALRFATKAEALIFWRTQSRVRPLRPDGEPNRPLTALSVEILALP